VDVVLLDLGLPDSPVTDTLTTVLEAHSYLPVIVLTSLNDLEFGSEGVSKGAQDYLVKTHLNGELLHRAIRYAAERKRIQTELQRSNEVLKGFAHTVAHEVRSPLNIVVCGLQLLQMRYGSRLDEKGRQTLQDILQATFGMSELVTELLEFARVGSRERVFDQVNMQQVLDQALAMLAPTIAETQAEITASPLPTVQGDAIQLQHLLQNLLGNAMKYRSERPPRIHVQAGTTDTGWTFRIQDNGIGIPRADQERIFDIFVRLQSGQAYPGTGIGLAFCKQIVEFHGGRIWVESEPGQGSTFCFTLPATPAAQLPMEQREPVKIS
jgi:light-regulated signal transduction histidine kinase (bacteriophytochrome)